MDKVSGIGHHFMKLSINAEDLQDLNLTSLDMTKNFEHQSRSRVVSNRANPKLGVKFP
jgi:hypothetical protein